MNKKMIKRILDGAKKLKIIVWGDAMLDVYRHASAVRMCPEAPVPTVELSHSTYALGGAANVAAGIASLGAKTELVACVGADKHWTLMRKLCDFYGVGTSFVAVSKRRKTTTKTRFIRGSHIMFRIDDDHKKPWNAVNVLSNAMESFDPNALVVSDYAKGAVINNAMMHVYRTDRMALYVSPKPCSDLHLRFADAVLCNRNEAYELTSWMCQSSDPPSTFAKSIMDVTGVKNVVITMDALGVLVASKGLPPVNLIQTAVAIGNTCGAGDTFLAAFTVAHKVLGDAIEAAEFGNHCAGLAVQHIGTTVVTKDML